MIDIEFKETYNPKPSEALIKRKEEYWRVKLPESYRQFLLKYNGGVPVKQTFWYKNHGYCVVSFLCLLEDKNNNDDGWFDISVVLTQIEDRLVDDEDMLGTNLVPIAEMFGCDYLCLDFRENPDEPCVCAWWHEESGDFDPVTSKIADSFEDFIDMLE